jgi:hypothetical protein
MKPAWLPNLALMTFKFLVAEGKALLLTSFSILRMKLIPPWETPPPMTTTCGFKRLTALAMPEPRYSHVLFMTSVAKKSPLFSALKRILVVSFSGSFWIILWMIELLSFFSSLLVSLTMAGAEAYISKQPNPPQLHLRPLWHMVMCPNSAPAKLEP